MIVKKIVIYYFILIFCNYLFCSDIKLLSLSSLYINKLDINNSDIKKIIYLCNLLKFKKILQLKLTNYISNYKIRKKAISYTNMIKDKVLPANELSILFKFITIDKKDIFDSHRHDIYIKNLYITHNKNNFIIKANKFNISKYSINIRNFNSFSKLERVLDMYTYMSIVKFLESYKNIKSNYELLLIPSLSPSIFNDILPYLKPIYNYISYNLNFTYLFTQDTIYSSKYFLNNFINSDIENHYISVYGNIDNQLYINILNNLRYNCKDIKLTNLYKFYLGWQGDNLKIVIGDYNLILGKGLVINSLINYSIFNKYKSYNNYINIISKGLYYSNTYSTNNLTGIALNYDIYNHSILFYFFANQLRDIIKYNYHNIKLGSGASILLRSLFDNSFEFNILHLLYNKSQLNNQSIISSVSLDINSLDYIKFFGNIAASKNIYYGYALLSGMRLYIINNIYISGSIYYISKSYLNLYSGYFNNTFYKDHPILKLGFNFKSNSLKTSIYHKIVFNSLKLIKMNSFLYFDIKFLSNFGFICENILYVKNNTNGITKPLVYSNNNVIKYSTLNKNIIFSFITKLKISCKNTIVHSNLLGFKYKHNISKYINFNIVSYYFNIFPHKDMYIYILNNNNFIRKFQGFNVLSRRGFKSIIFISIINNYFISKILVSNTLYKHKINKPNHHITFDLLIKFIYSD